MALENSIVLENLKSQKVEVEKQIESAKEMYLKICGAVEVLEQIEESKQESEQEIEEQE